MKFNNQIIEKGLSFSYSRKLSKNLIEDFAKVSGDYNPIHLDEDYASTTVFKKPVAHGILMASMFSYIFGNHYPGVGSIYISQNLRFKKPVYVDDVVLATVTVESVNYEKRRIKFSTVCAVEGSVVVTGDAEIFLPS